jgi:hypothetical protein
MWSEMMQERGTALMLARGRLGKDGKLLFFGHRKELCGGGVSQDLVEAAEG